MASHVCSSRYGRLPCIRTCFALVPAYRSLASLIHPDSQTQVWSTKAEGTLSQAGTLARSSLRLACPPLRALHLPHFFRTLPAAPCCTWPSRLHSQFLHPAVCTHPGHPAPCNPASPFRIAAPCPSRRHYPRSWHASTSTESSTVPHYDCMPQYGYSAWTWDRAWPSPPLTVEGQSRSPLPCPSSVSAMTIPLSDPDQAQHRGRPASQPAIHPSIHRQCSATTTHLCAAQGTLTLEPNPPTTVRPGACSLPPSIPSNACSSHWPRRAFLHQERAGAVMGVGDLHWDGGYLSALLLDRDKARFLTDCPASKGAGVAILATEFPNCDAHTGANHKLAALLR